MNHTGPIIIIEDDLDDQEILGEVLKELEYKNKVIFFSDGEKALTYLTSTDIEPFIIFSDINMPKLNGMELRAKIHENEDLRIKSIPYLFSLLLPNRKALLMPIQNRCRGFSLSPQISMSCATL